MPLVPSAPTRGGLSHPRVTHRFPVAAHSPAAAVLFRTGFLLVAGFAGGLPVFRVVCATFEGGDSVVSFSGFAEAVGAFDLALPVVPVHDVFAGLGWEGSSLP